jgi:hypothetical protein
MEIKESGTKMVSKQTIIESFRKGLKDKTNLFIRAMFLLMVVAIIFGVMALFSVQSSTNASPLLNKHNISFNIDLFNKLPITAILSTIAGALAAILAIVFAISQIIISNLSERYSPYILERYKNDPKTMRTLFGFVTVITSSISLLLVNAFLPPTISFMLLSVLLFGFVYSFSLFIKYFYFMFEIINPLKFTSILEKKTVEQIKNQNEEEIQNYISSMGDISIKSLQRNEERVCKEYIQTLHNVFEEFLKLKEANLEKYKSVVNLSYYDRDNAKNNILGYVLDQYLRIYKEAVFRKEETIEEEISKKLFSILYECLTGKDTDVLIEEIIETRGIIGAKYYQFCKIGIENKASSRLRLIRNLCSILQINQYKPNKIEDKRLEEFLTFHLFRINQLIIDYADFELFTEEIDNFSRMLIIKSPNELQNDIENDLAEVLSLNLYQNEDIFREIERKGKYLRFIIKYKISGDFEAKNEFEEGLEEFKNFIIAHIENEDNINRIKERIDSIKHKLYELYMFSNIHKTFFMISAYILFKGKEDKIDAERYLKELWEHTSPEDADAHFGNKSPVSFDPFWITYLLFYGGKNSDIWFDDYRFEDFHGFTSYIYQYYLLCIAKSVEKGRINLGLPQKNDLEKMMKENRTYELDELYQFSNGFELKAEDLIKYCNGLIEKSDNWNALFKNNAKESLEKTKEWIDRTSKECKTAKEEIETILPLDPEKVAKCREDIFKSYKESSKIPEVVQVKEFDEERDKELEFIQKDVRQLIPKDCLIKPSFVGCNKLWFDLGRVVAVGETNYLIKRILEDERIERVRIRGVTPEEIFDEIKSVVGNLKEQKYKPSIVFIPLEILTEFVKKRLAKTFELLKIDEDTELKVINSSKLTPFEDIIILDKTAGIWAFEPDEEAEERLIIEIKECDTDKSKVDLLVKMVVNFRIVDPKAIKNLKIEQGSSISA